ncbi:hypothetical protein [Leptolyngbya ohadii]|uniref:hypothetical protein n=1 Tax=Leptolyngbya ohadii TaxID=1962290 RepID=UPI00117AB9C1|nr:hypothetical protein [Leptolyngbya ohadii]
MRASISTGLSAAIACRGTLGRSVKRSPHDMPQVGRLRAALSLVAALLHRVRGDRLLCCGEAGSSCPFHDRLQHGTVWAAPQKGAIVRLSCCV